MMRELHPLDAGFQQFFGRILPAKQRTIASASVSGRANKSILDHLVSVLRSGAETEAFEASKAINRLGSKSATKMVAACLGSSVGEPNRWFAMDVLHRLLDRRSRRALLSVLRDRRNSDYLRGKAADVLSAFSADPLVMRELLAGTEDASAYVRFFCLHSLRGQLTDRRVRSVFERAVSDDTPCITDEPIGQFAARALEYVTSGIGYSAARARRQGRSNYGEYAKPAKGARAPSRHERTRPAHFAGVSLGDGGRLGAANFT